MTARTDRSDLGRYSPVYATGREFGAMSCRGLLEGAKGLTLDALGVRSVVVEGRLAVKLVKYTAKG